MPCPAEGPRRAVPRPGAVVPEVRQHGADPRAGRLAGDGRSGAGTGSGGSRRDRGANDRRLASSACCASTRCCGRPVRRRHWSRAVWWAFRARAAATKLRRCRQSTPVVVAPVAEPSDETTSETPPAARSRRRSSRSVEVGASSRSRAQPPPQETVAEVEKVDAAGGRTAADRERAGSKPEKPRTLTLEPVGRRRPRCPPQRPLTATPDYPPAIEAEVGAVEAKPQAQTGRGGGAAGAGDQRGRSVGGADRVDRLAGDADRRVREPGLRHGGGADRARRQGARRSRPLDAESPSPCTATTPRSASYSPACSRSTS